MSSPNTCVMFCNLTQVSISGGIFYAAENIERTDAPKILKFGQVMCIDESDLQRKIRKNGRCYPQSRANYRRLVHRSCVVYHHMNSPTLGLHQQGVKTPS